jgi:hypothetical protein
LSAKTEANDAKAHDSAVGLGSAVGLQRDPRLKYLAILTEHGPLNLGGLAARSRFCGRFEALRADLAWLANQGYVVESAQGICALTPKGITAMAAIGVWKKKE